MSWISDDTYAPTDIDKLADTVFDEPLLVEYDVPPLFTYSYTSWTSSKYGLAWRIA